VTPKNDLPLAVLAGGRGLRLTGGRSSKPLFEVYGRPLISYILDAACAAGVSRCFVLVREDDHDVARYLASREADFEVLSIIRSRAEGTGPACRALVESLESEQHILATSDLIISASALETMLERFATQDPSRAGVLATTARIGADRPVWVEVSGEGVVTDYGKDIDPQPRVWGNVRVMREVYSRWIMGHPEILQDTVLTKTFVRSRRTAEIDAVPIDDLYDVDTVEEIDGTHHFLHPQDYQLENDGVRFHP